jgi:hypothetical protein
MQKSFQERLADAIQRQLLPQDMAIEYRHQWKEMTTPEGRVIPKLAASAVRTLDNDFSGSLNGYPTPNTKPEAPNGSLTRENGQKRDRKTTQCLGEVAEMLTGWVTPSARDHKDTPGMATTATNPDGSIRQRTDQLPRQAALVNGWNTPRATDGSKGSRTPEGVQKELARKGNIDDLPSQAILSGATTESSPAETEKPGVLDPQLPCWLQGYPVDWLMCAPEKKPTRTTEQQHSKG